MSTPARLDELDPIELGDVARLAGIELTDEEWQEKWDRFIELKRLKGLQ